MKTFRSFFPLFIAFAFCIHAAGVAQPYSVKLDIVPVFASQDSVVVAAKIQSNTATNFRVEAVYVTLAYDPAAFTVDSIRLIKNRYFAQYGWSNDCIPFFDHDGVYPDLAMYGESTPNFVARTMSGTGYFQLCTFTFFPRTPDGTTSFTVSGNTATAATTGYYIPTSSDNQVFAPVNELINYYYAVELQSFTAFQQGRAVALNWITASETNNAGFNIQRRAAGDTPKDWVDIQFVRGAGDSRQQITYNDFDFSLTQNGRYEYRLRQVDFDGTESFSKIATVDYVDRPSTFALGRNYPNPVSASMGEQTSIPYSIAERSTVTLKITDALGREIDVLQRGAMDQGGYTALWRPTGLPAGLYFVTLIADGAESGRHFSASMKITVTR